jgi:NAD(P)-dependent dehydrogenase (short-subunit alcohol dehydrogenase family)
MGRSIALTLARERAAVVINYRTSHKQANTLVKHIQDQGGTATAVQADVFSADGCRSLIQAVNERFGHVDICVISPGSGWHPEPPDQLEPDAALEDITHEVAPCLYFLPLVLPAMYEREWGRIIAITTNPHLPSPAFAYNVAKATRAQVLLHAQDATWQHNVTVNVIAPGPVAPIESFAEAIEQCDHGAAWQHRPTTSPQDVAESVAFLCSEAGRFITGCTIPFQFRLNPTA